MCKACHTCEVGAKGWQILQQSCSGQASDAKHGHWWPHWSSLAHRLPLGRCAHGTQQGMMQPGTAQGRRHGIQACTHGAKVSSQLLLPSHVMSYIILVVKLAQNAEPLQDWTGLGWTGCTQQHALAPFLKAWQAEMQLILVQHC